MFNKKMCIAQSWIFLVNISLKVSGYDEVGILITKVADNNYSSICISWILLDLNYTHNILSFTITL